MRNITINFLVLLFIISCSGEENDMVTMQIGPPEILYQLSLDLEKNGIKHYVIGEDSINFYRVDMDRVMKLSDVIVSEIIPKEKSFSPATASLFYATPRNLIAIKSHIQLKTLTVRNGLY